MYNVGSQKRRTFNVFRVEAFDVQGCSLAEVSFVRIVTNRSNQHRPDYLASRSTIFFQSGQFHIPTLVEQVQYV